MLESVIVPPPYQQERFRLQGQTATCSAWAMTKNTVARVVCSTYTHIRHAPALVKDQIEGKWLRKGEKVVYGNVHDATYEGLWLVAPEIITLSDGDTLKVDDIHDTDVTGYVHTALPERRKPQNAKVPSTNVSPDTLAISQSETTIPAQGPEANTTSFEDLPKEIRTMI
ncbi:hypothetical protein G7Y89_g5321 [Cudoniella acicularis]|uniref:Uncharacterized protein n=1 Tax=Cudoniella acicularis TaxID=354080 RepID=A0A8H4W6L3_9HELO|nr:hypothetical protein G7Y89_g5321 [Cudoniella acicularis]